jgi:ABC-type branched-subunit amino acid transport system substrate-binding protein
MTTFNQRFLRLAAGLAIAAISLAARADITLLQVAPLSGPYGGIGWHIQVGAQVAFAETNGRGGIGGQKLKLASYDQEADISKQVRELVEKQQPVALFGMVGDDTVKKLADDRVLADTGLPLVGARMGAASVVALSKQIYLTRPGFEYELSRVLRQFSISGIKSVALVYEDDSYGREVLGFAKKLAGANGQTLTSVGYLAGSAQVDEAVAKMTKAQPQAIILASQTAGAAAFIQRFRSQGGSSQLATLSYVEGSQLAKVIGTQAAHGVGVLEVSPNTLNEAMPLVREFRAAFKKYGPADVEPTQAMMESYVAARALTEALKRAGGNKAKLVAALGSLDHYDLGGLPITFSGEHRYGTEFAELAVIDRTGRVLR